MLSRSITKALLVGTFLLIGMFDGGCTVNYELNTVPISKWQDHERLPVKVNLVLSDQLRAYVFDKGNFEGDHFRYPICLGIRRGRYDRGPEVDRVRRARPGGVGQDCSRRGKT